MTKGKSPAKGGKKKNNKVKLRKGQRGDEFQALLEKRKKGK